MEPTPTVTVIEQICHSNDFFIVVNNRVVYGLVYGKDIAQIGEESLLDIVKQSIMAATSSTSEDVQIYVRDWTEEIYKKMNEKNKTRLAALKLLLEERGPVVVR